MYWNFSHPFSTFYKNRNINNLKIKRELNIQSGLPEKTSRVTVCDNIVEIIRHAGLLLNLANY